MWYYIDSNNMQKSGSISIIWAKFAPKMGKIPQNDIFQKMQPNWAEIY